MNRLLLVAVVATLAGPVLAYFGYQEKQKIEKIEKDGVEVVGNPVSGSMRKGRRGSKTYKVHVIYPDTKGGTISQEFKVKRGFFESISSGDLITADAVSVKLLPDQPKEAFIVGGSDDDRAMFPVGIGAFVVGGIGTAFLVRKDRQA